MMSTLTAHCQWEDETVRERTGHPPSYAEAKKVKSLTLHTHGCPRASLRDRSSSFFFFILFGRCSHPIFLYIIVLIIFHGDPKAPIPNSRGRDTQPLE